MEKTALEKVRKLNHVLQGSATGAYSFDDLCEILGELMDANIYIVSISGRILSVFYTISKDSNAVTDPETGMSKLPDEYNAELLKTTETLLNLQAEEALKIFKYDYDTKEKYHTIIPIYGGGVRLGTMVMTRYEPAFTDEDLILGEYGATVVGVEIRRHEDLAAEGDQRVKQTVVKAIETLSYSEIEAIQQIFEELKASEGLLVASKVADRAGITRSVIVNALRKLESAGVIESRSLGMKGTHIRVLNRYFLEELNKTKL